MKHFSKYFFSIIIIVSLLSPQYASAYKGERIWVVIDGQYIALDTDPILRDNRVLIPLRGVFRNLDAEVDWDSKKNTATITQGRIVIEVTVGSKIAKVNNKEVMIDVPPLLHQNRTYVPLRFITEAIGAEVKWNSSSREVRITWEGTPQFNNRFPQTGSVIKGIKMGDSFSKVSIVFGKEKDKTKSRHGFDWYHYFNDDYSDYAQIGIKDGKVVAMFLNHPNFKINDSISLYDSKDKVRKTLGSPTPNQSESDFFELSDSYLWVLYDKHDLYRATGFKLIGKEIERTLLRNYAKGTPELMSSYEREMFHLLNAIRSRNLVPILSYNPDLARVSFAHSLDMATNNYFAHESLDGRSPGDRIRNAGIAFSLSGENCSMGYYSAIFSMNGLMNSLGHRRNILNTSFKEVGIGVAFSSNQVPYYTQKFLTK